MLFKIIGRMLSAVENFEFITSEIYYSDENPTVNMKFIKNDLSRKLLTLKSNDIVNITGEYNNGIYNIDELSIIDKDTPLIPLKYDDCEKFIIKCVCGHVMDSRTFNGKCTKCGQSLLIK